MLVGFSNTHTEQVHGYQTNVITCAY